MKVVNDDAKKASRKIEENPRNRNSNQDIPDLPSWLTERNNLSWDFPNEVYNITASIGILIYFILCYFISFD